MSGHPVPSAKAEFPPLLDIGRHPMSLRELGELSVDAFPGSATRGNIMDGLSCVIRRLEECGVQGELWIDGSFLTQKFDPEDVDVVLRIGSDMYDNASDEQRSVIEWLEDNLKESHHCDSYVYTEFPEDHPAFWFGEYMYAYWMKQWGFSRGEAFKGIAVYVLGEVTPDAHALFFHWMSKQQKVSLQPPSARGPWT